MKNPYFGGVQIACVVLALKQFKVILVERRLIALGDNSNNDVLGFDSRLLFLSADIILPFTPWG